MILKKVWLHGYLAERFGQVFEFDINRPSEAITALGHQLAGFWQAIEPGTFRIICGPQEEEKDLSLEQMTLSMGDWQEVHIIPWVAGSGGRAGGIVKLVLGVGLLAFGIGGAFIAGGAAGIGAGFAATAFQVASIGVSYGTLALVGLGLTLTGVSALTSPRLDLKPGGENYDSRELADQRPSFLLNAPVNRFEQGGPVPLVYGRCRVGSVVVNLGLRNEAI